MNAQTHACTNCGQLAPLATVNYRYTESGLPNVVLQGIHTSSCPHCGNEDVLIPRMEKIHRAIAQARANSPSRLNGQRLRLLRLLVAILDSEIRPAVPSIAEHLPLICDDDATQWELHINATTLQASFLSVAKAA